MPEEGPPPIVPTMQERADPPKNEDKVRADGGIDPEADAPDRPFGAPLVPDCR